MTNGTNAQRVSKSFGRGKGTSTPWGKAQYATSYTRGITFYGTAGHGGFKVCKTMNDKMPAVLRNADGWYEEDSEWAKVATAFPDLFTAEERQQADSTLRNWNPDAWEALNGRKLTEAESYVRANQGFDARHSEDMIVIAALIDKDDRTKTRCIATKGGKRGNGVAEETFLVPGREYETRSRFGFVIDRARHRSLGQKGLYD